MASQLSRVTPLDCFLNLTKLDRCHLELPNDNHLIVTATGKVLSIGAEAHDIDSGGVATLQIILVLWLIALRSARLLLILSGGLNGCKMVAIFRNELPVADTRVKLIDLRAGDEASGVGEKVQGHDTG